MRALRPGTGAPARLTLRLKPAPSRADSAGMARMIAGGVLVLWGSAIIISSLLRDYAGGAFGTGQRAASVFAIAMVALGVRAIVKARAAQG